MKRQKWSAIKDRVKPETRARIEAEARRLSDDLHLSQLRKARGLTQEAMNGELVIAARFADDVEVPITLVDAEDAA